MKYTAAADNPVELLSGDYSQSVGGGLAIERIAVLQQGNWINTEMADVIRKLQIILELFLYL